MVYKQVKKKKWLLNRLTILSSVVNFAELTLFVWPVKTSFY